MTDRIEPTDPYVAEHAREALAADPRTAGLELDVGVAGDAIVLRGMVSTEQRKSAASEVIEERFPGWTVHNELVAREFEEPKRAEHLQ